MKCSLKGLCCTLSALLVALATSATTATAGTSFPPGTVAINGLAVTGAELRPDIAIEIAELRENGSPLIRLVPGSKIYRVQVVSRNPIPAFESQFPVTAAPMRFVIGSEGSRSYNNCVLAGLLSEGSGSGYRNVYGLRCEDVSP